MNGTSGTPGWGQPLTREEAAKVGGPEKLCFSEKPFMCLVKKCKKFHSWQKYCHEGF